MDHKIGYQWTEKELVHRILDGDKAAFRVVIEKTERLVTQIICKMISNTHDRKDLVQDTYLKAYNSLPAFSFRSKISTWIATIAYNTCIDYLRRKRPVLYMEYMAEQEIKEAGNNEIEEVMIKQHRSLILQAFISRLPPVYRTLVTLFHNETLSYEEIAEVTGLPEGTIKNYLFRARKMLKKNLLENYKKEDL